MFSVHLWWWKTVASFKAIALIVYEKSWLKHNTQPRKWFSKSKRGNNYCKKQDGVMLLAVQGQLMMVNKCCKFQSNSFDSLREKVDLNIKLNQEIWYFLSPKGAINLAKSRMELCFLLYRVSLWWWTSVASFKAIALIV